MRTRHTPTAEERAARFGGPPEELHRARMHWILIAFVVAFTAISMRLAQLHLNPHLELTNEERFHFGEVILREPRGEIFDRNGLVLATNRDVPSLWVDPRGVEDSLKLSVLLSLRLGMSTSEVIEKLSLRDERGNQRKFVWLKRWIQDKSEEELREIERLSNGAVQLQYEPLRTYPQADTAAHLLGFVNRNGEASEGVELTFNKYLESIPGKKVARKDARRRMLESQVYQYQEPQGGDMLQLTLDTAIQHSLEQALDQRMIECNAPRAMGIVMDPHTGAILALASRPAFDPNRYDEFDAELRKNRAIIDVYEPGSAFKIVPAAAGIEHGLVTPATIIDTHGGYWNPYGHRISDFTKFRGPETFLRCFEKSSNIALIKVGAMLGDERLENWIKLFGFGAPTSSDFPLESRGILRPRVCQNQTPGHQHNANCRWNKLSMGSLPMGQEISVTMPQMAKSFAIIANGGYDVEPYFVERAVSRYGDVTYQREHAERQRLLSPQTAKTMQHLLHQVVLNGTGAPALMPEYTAGGKTGTAQMVLPGGRGYSSDRYTTVFAGFAPASNPELVAVIVVQEPMIERHYGGYVCGPVFKEVVRDALVRMGVPPDREPAPEQPRKPATPEKPVLVAKQAEEESPRSHDADTIVRRLTPEELEKSFEAMMEPLDGLQLLTVAEANNKQGDLPDLRGLSKREALAKLSEIGIPWDARGAGWVTEQAPPPGTPLRKVTLCALEFATNMTLPSDEHNTTL